MNKMLIQQLLVAVSLVCWHSYSYSEYIYGSSGNAADAGLNWVMENVIPQYTGLAVNGIVYQYTTVKDAEDDMVVYVQNENAEGTGYIFRNADNWSGLPGNTIKRIVPIGYVPLEYWGDGSIEVEGTGEVTDPRVIYTYRYDDTCIVNPQSDPSCPDYKEIEIPKTPEYEVTADTVLQDELDRQQTFKDEEQERRDFERIADEEKKKIRLTELEKLLGKLELNDLQGPSEQLHTQMISLNYLTPQYAVELRDPGYEDTVVLQGGELPDNKNGRRLQLANDEQHDRIVELQYKN